MASKSRQVQLYLTALVTTALPSATVKLNPKKASPLAPGGAANIRPGSATKVGELMSPYRKIYSHAIPLELATKADNEDEALDTMLEAIRAAVVADRTLGGLVDFADPDFPDLEPIEVVGGEAAAWAATSVTVEYVV